MNQFRKTTADSRGFTLVETIAVLIILGILAAVAFTRIGSMQQDLVAEADMVKTHLRFAQLKALSDDVNAWSIVFATNSYTLTCSGASCPTPSSFLPGESGTSHAFSSSVTATTAPTVNFDSWGSPGTAAIPIVLSQGGTTTTITVAANTGYITP